MRQQVPNIAGLAFIGFFIVINKFIRRFNAVEAALADAGRSPIEASLEEMEALWQKAKTAQD